MKEAFSRFLRADPERLHFAAHSHHPWPDVSYEAHLRAWEDAARLMDDKWEHVFGEVFPAARAGVADALRLPDPNTLVFGPNTHEFVMRIASTLPRPFRLLTTDSEFHSFSRQVLRWEQAGWLDDLTVVAAEPFETFPVRFENSFSGHDLVYFSQVHFNSGYVTPDLEDLVMGFPPETTVVVDGYHAFMAVPTHLDPLADRCFYVAGGYKYAMAGENACFLHVPPSVPDPVDTGWFAGFGALADTAPDTVPFADGGQRYAGATFDPSGVYRLEAVLGWLAKEGVDTDDIHRHVVSLQEQTLDGLPAALADRLIPSRGPRGHFLTFRLDDAEGMYRRLHDRKVITDYRNDRWRVGFGIYHDASDVERLLNEIRTATG